MTRSRRDPPVMLEFISRQHERARRSRALRDEVRAQSAATIRLDNNGASAQHPEREP